MGRDGGAVGPGRGLLLLHNPDQRLRAPDPPCCTSRSGKPVRPIPPGASSLAPPPPPHGVCPCLQDGRPLAYRTSPGATASLPCSWNARLFGEMLPGLGSRSILTAPGAFPSPQGHASRVLVDNVVPPNLACLAGPPARAPPPRPPRVRPPGGPPLPWSLPAYMCLEVIRYLRVDSPDEVQHSSHHVVGPGDEVLPGCPTMQASPVACQRVSPGVASPILLCQQSCQNC